MNPINFSKPQSALTPPRRRDDTLHSSVFRAGPRREPEASCRPTQGGWLAMAKPRSRTIDFVAYMALRLAVCFVQALPDGGARALGHWLGWAAFHLDTRHRRVVDDNLRHA